MLRRAWQTQSIEKLLHEAHSATEAGCRKTASTTEHATGGWPHTAYNHTTLDFSTLIQSAEQVWISLTYLRLQQDHILVACSSSWQVSGALRFVCTAIEMQADKRQAKRRGWLH